MIDRVARAPISIILLVAAVATVLRLLVYPIIMRTAIHKRAMGYGFAKLINEGADALVYAAIVVFMLVRPFGIQTFVIPSGSMIDTLHVSDYIVANKWVYRVSPPQRGDIVVFKPPTWVRATPTTDEDFIKRLIGLPGDLIEIKDAQLVRNGVKVPEPYWTYTDPTAHDRSQTVIPKARWNEIKIANWKLVTRVDPDTGASEVTPLQYSGDSANEAFSETNVNAKYAVEKREEMIKLIGQPAVKVPEGYYLFLGDNRNGSNDGRMWGLVPRESIVGKAWFVWLPFSRAKFVDRAPAGSTG